MLATAYCSVTWCDSAHDVGHTGSRPAVYLAEQTAVVHLRWARSEALGHAVDLFVYTNDSQHNC